MRLILLVALAFAGCAPVETAGPGTTTGGRGATVRPEVNNGAGYEFLISRDATSTYTSAIPSAPAVAWESLVGAYATLQIPDAVATSPRFEIASRNLIVRARLVDRPLSVLFDCGRIVGGPIANIYRIRLSVVSTLQATDSAWSRLVTRVDAIASDPTSGGSGVRCTSTGELEKRIAALTAVGLAN